MAESRGTSPTVTVACKIYFPWIDLQLCEKKQVMENTQTGPREVTQYEKTGPIVRIRGLAYPNGVAPDGFPERPQIIAGYALTRDVPRAFWEEWVKQNEKAPMVANHLIFAFENHEDIKAKGREHEKTFSGIEPLRRVPDGTPQGKIDDGRMPPPMSRAVTVGNPTSPR